MVIILVKIARINKSTNVVVVGGGVSTTQTVFVWIVMGQITIFARFNTCELKLSSTKKNGTDKKYDRCVGKNHGRNMYSNTN